MSAHQEEMVRALGSVWAPEETRRSVARALAGADPGVRKEVARLLDPPRNGTAPEGEAQDRSLSLLTLADLLENPELLRPPAVVVPRLSWAGRLTLFSSREKIGKTTTAAEAAAAKSRGRNFLGESCDPGVVLWVALEEHPGDLARRFVAFDALPELVHILDRTSTPLLDLRKAVEEVQPDLTVVDTLPALVRSLRPESGSSSDWSSIMGAIREITRESDTGMVLLHHQGKGTGTYRDSTAIGAEVDCILEMHREESDHQIRRVDATARWNVPGYEFRLDGDPMEEGGSGRLTLVGGGLSIREQIIAHVARNPGCSQRDLRRTVTAKTRAIQDAVQGLLRSRDIVDQGDSRGMALFLPQETAGNRDGTTREPPREPGRRAGSGSQGHPPMGGVPPSGTTLPPASEGEPRFDDDSYLQDEREGMTHG